MLTFPVICGTALKCGNRRSIAAVNLTGKINVAALKDKKVKMFENVPFLRGITILIFGLYYYFLSLRQSAIINGNSFELNAQSKNFKHYPLTEKKIAGLSVVSLIFLCIVIGFFVLTLVPHFMVEGLVKSGVPLGFILWIYATFRVAIFYLLFLGLRFLPTVKQILRNNSAANLLENAGLNYHKSTNFLNYVVSGLLFSVFVLSFNVIKINYFLVVLINIVLCAVCFSLIYEVLLLLQHKTNKFARGAVFITSFLVCEKPTTTEKEIARVAFEELQLMMKDDEREIGVFEAEKISLSSVLCEIKNKLESVGVDDPAEAEWLLADVLGKNRAEIKTIKNISKEEYRKVKSVLVKRAKRMPLSKITGKVNFYGLDFYVDKNVLSPRAETELLVEQVLKLQPKNKTTILDLCTGSGCIAVCLAKKTGAKIIASDVSELAIKVAKKNAKDNNVKVKFVVSDLFKSLKKQKFDVIVSNPPYIESDDIKNLMPEVKFFDPLIALDGGADGLSFYREIIASAPKHLSKKGVILFEIGSLQAKNVKKLLQKQFEHIKILKDYSGNDRIVIAQLKD